MVLSLGTGLKVFLTRNLSLRPDFRLYLDLKSRLGAEAAVRF